MWSPHSSLALEATAWEEGPVLNQDGPPPSEERALEWGPDLFPVQEMTGPRPVPIQETEGKREAECLWGGPMES